MARIYDPNQGIYIDDATGQPWSSTSVGAGSIPDNSGQSIGNLYGGFGGAGLPAAVPTDYISTPGQAPANADQPQSPGIFGTGQFFAKPYPGFNPALISGNPSAGAADNYGLNDVWSRLQSATNNLQPQNYATTAAQLGAPPQMTAAQGAAATGTAAQGSAAQGVAAQGTASTMNPAFGLSAPIGAAAMGNAAGISTAGDAQWQEQQRQLANVLANTANGGGVSPADLQLQRGGEQNIASQLAVLGSQRGNMGNAGLASRAAADRSMAVQAQTNQQMGIQRAQETLAAQQALGAVAGTGRAQSQNYNTALANLLQQSTLANQSSANNMTGLNLGNLQGLNLANLGNAQQGGMFNAGQYQGMTLADMLARNTMTSQNSAQAQGAMLANLNAKNTFGLADLGNTQSMTLANMGNLQASNLANLGVSSQYGLQQGAFNQATALANQQAAEYAKQQQYNQFLALMGAQTGVGESNRAAQLAAQQLGVQQQSGLNTVNANMFNSAAQANANLAGGVIGAGGSILAQLIDAYSRSNAGGAPATAGPIWTNATDTIGGYSGTTGGPNPSSYDATAQSDENLKTGIQGGNPMMRSFLEQYQEFATKAAPSINPTEGVRLEGRAGTAGGYGVSGGSHSGSQIGGSIGSAGGGAAGAAGGAALGAAAGSVVPGIGTAIGGIVGGIIGGTAGSVGGGAAGSAIGSNFDSQGHLIGGPGSSGSAPTDVAGVGNDSQDLTSEVQPDWSKLFASSDDREKEAITSGNRGMQAFLTQANAQQQAAATQGGQNNSFMQTGSAPSAQVDRQLPPMLNPNAGYGMGGGGGGIYGGGVMQPGGGIAGGGSTSGSVAGGGMGSMGGITQDWTMNPGGVTSSGGASGGGGGSMPSAPMIYNDLPQTPQQQQHIQGLRAPMQSAPPPMIYNQLPTPAQTAQHLDALRGLTSNAMSGPIQAAPGPIGALSDMSQLTPQAPPLQAAPGGVGGLGDMGMLGTNVSPARGLADIAAAVQPAAAPPAAPDFGFQLPWGMTAFSDERAKTEVGTTDPKALQAFMDSIHAHQYRYKDPTAPGAGPGTYISPMAQEIEKTPVGRGAVFEGPDGHKMVNYGHLAGTMLAGQAMLNERLNEHEDIIRRSLGQRSH
jgi:hypothetical protein